MNLFGILALSVVISWMDPNPPEIGVTHYTFYMGIQSVVQGNPPVMTWTIQVPATQQLVDGLEYGTTYYFAVKVWNVSGPSEYSGELVWTPMPDPTPTPTPTPTPVPPTPTPEPTPTVTPVPLPTPDLPGLRKGWWKNNEFP